MSGEGEIVALVGPNGAGKSTMLGAVLGSSPPRRRGPYLGESIRGLAPEAIARRGIALVPEGRHIFGTLTVEENLLLGAIASADGHRPRAGWRTSWIDSRCCGRTLRAPANVLSGGEQQQLAIARALVARPRLLLLDEPSLGLAPQLVERVLETVEEIRREGMTILLVEQNGLQAVELADRTYVLRSGRIVLAGSRADLIAAGEFDAAYLGF